MLDPAAGEGSRPACRMPKSTFSRGACLQPKRRRTTLPSAVGPHHQGTHTSSGQFLLYDQTLPFTGRSWIFGLHVKSPSWASLIAQLVKNPPAMQETPIPFLGWEDPLEKG